MKQDLEIWIARDKDGTLCVFGHKPWYNMEQARWCDNELVPENEFVFYECNDVTDWIILREDLFPNITCENSPQLLTLSIQQQNEQQT